MWVPHPYIFGGPKEGGNATSPLHSRGSATPSVGSKIRSGPQQRGTKSEVAASPLPSPWAQKRAEMLRHPYILGDPQRQARRVESEVVLNKWEQNLKWLPHPAFSGAQKRVEMLRHPYILGDPQRQRRGVKSEQVPNKGEQNQKWLPNTCPLGDPKEGGSATSPMHSGRPKRGRKCYVTPSFSGVHNAKRGEQNQKWSPTKGNKIRSGCLTLPSRWPKRGRKCYVTPAFSGILNAKRAE